MKVYFTASLTGKSKYLANYKAIVDHLKKLGVEVVCEHIMSTSAYTTRHDSPEERTNYVNYLNHWLTKCDAMIAETSYPSTSIGFEICYALQRKKPVAVFYTTEAGFPPVVAGLLNNQLYLEEYDLSTLSTQLESVIEEIDHQKFQRFTMLIPPHLQEYLDSLSKEGINRSEYIRDLIERDRALRKL